MATVLIPIPEMDFDPTEVAISWKVLTAHGHRIIFATPNGLQGRADEIMLTGRGLDPWSLVPGLRAAPLVGLMLRANTAARRAYAEMQQAKSFRVPIRWADARDHHTDGLLLPGGHRSRGMRSYLESGEIHRLVLSHFATRKPVAAICHGVLAAARSIDPTTGKSVLHGRKTTALTWSLEKMAWRTARRTRFWDPAYYRTYLEQAGQPAGYMSVQHEVTRALALPEDFLDVPADSPDRFRKVSGLVRDTPDDDRPAWVVRDGNYVSARWPGDANKFVNVFSKVLAE